MKRKLVKVIVTITLASIITFTSCIPVPVAANVNALYTPPTLKYALNKRFYSLTGIVTNIFPLTSKEDQITITCANGNIFQFRDDTESCWDVGDLASCMMDNNGTEYVTDDKVITAMYAGSLEQLEAQCSNAK